MKKTSCINKDNNNCSCVHEFVRDLIDITPDKSMEITYCILCEFTLTNSNINSNSNQQK